MAPDPQQYMTSLVVANRVKLDRARFRRETLALPQAESRCRAAAVLREPELPEWAVGMRTDKLLFCVRRVGPQAASRFIRAAGITWQARTLGELSLRQRHAIADILEDAGHEEAAA